MWQFASLVTFKLQPSPVHRGMTTPLWVMRGTRGPGDQDAIFNSESIVALELKEEAKTLINNILAHMTALVCVLRRKQWSQVPNS